MPNYILIWGARFETLSICVHCWYFAIVLLVGLLFFLSCEYSRTLESKNYYFKLFLYCFCKEESHSSQSCCCSPAKKEARLLGCRSRCPSPPSVHERPALFTASRASQ